MNQGNSGKYKKNNGTFQDGALVLAYPGGKWRAFFFAFQSQVFKTDGKGNPLLKVSRRSPGRGGLRQRCVVTRHRAPNSC